MSDDPKAGALDPAGRRSAFASADTELFDLVVVGAGITGAGIAHDAARRGLKVALVEAEDVASGTSSRSSKMIHGGLRYLASGDVALVREAARERQVLRRVAPHLCQIADFTMPCSARMLATMRAGLVAFERLGRVPKSERHAVLKLDELLEREPLLRPDRLSGGVVYAEFLTNDARLTLANVRSAKAAGATVLTRAPVTSLILEAGRAAGVECQSSLEGESMGARIRARAVVNAAGPWVDSVRRMEAADGDDRLTLTKGIHVVVPAERLPVNDTVITLGRDKRPVFAVPVDDVVYVGTTDTFHPKAEVWPEIDRTDVEYLFDAMSDTFGGSRLEPSDVTAMWAGIRPLVMQEGKNPSEISRRDEMWIGPAGVRSIAGGKLTAYRTMASRVVDAVADDLERAVPRSRTDRTTLVGGDVDVAAAVTEIEGAVGRQDATRLVRLYGSEAGEVVEGGGDLAAEVRHAVYAEGALRLEDFWVRRSGRAWFSLDPVGDALDSAAVEMARCLGWGDKRRIAEVEACREVHTSALACLATDAAGAGVLEEASS